MVKNKYHLCIDILSRRKTLFILFCLLVGVIYSFLTGIIIMEFDPFSISTITSVYGITSLLFISILSAVFLTLQVHVFHLKHIRKHGKVGFFAMFISFLTTACPFCKPILLALIGFGGSIGFLVTYGLEITLLSVILLFFSIYLTLYALRKG